MKQKSILIISADAYQARFMFDCLSSIAGYAVQIAEQGEIALERIREVKPALVILDGNLPDLGYLAVISTIRSAADTQIAQVPIILIGGGLKEDDRLIGLEAGADICMNEILHPKVFVARIHSLLRRLE